VSDKGTSAQAGSDSGASQLATQPHSPPADEISPGSAGVPPAPINPSELVSELLPKLRTAAVTYFPIRHHSPACAAHIERWILEHKPSAVLVEGPSGFTSRIPYLTDDACRCPVALYTNFIDKKGRLDKLVALEGADLEDIVGSDFGAPRFSAYYPFCDYSPELVALRAGKSVGARLRFIDLEFAEMVLNRTMSGLGKAEDLLQVESLTRDSHLRHSQYINALAAKLGCRNFDELWDHLFETGWHSLSTDAFIDRMATYCAMARLDYLPSELSDDGTLAREACMAAAIREELEKNERVAQAAGAGGSGMDNLSDQDVGPALVGRTLVGPVLVVTGGFHTVVLPDLVAKKVQRPPQIEFSDGETGTWLMRYSFDKLDSLAGYSAGMPAPAYYDRLWHVGRKEPDERLLQFERIGADVLVDISRLTRQRGLPSLITTPDAIAAAQMSKQLAAMRGHAWPLREDILDGVRSCFVKGELGVEGQLLIALVNEIMAGNRIGQLPEGADLPPIVDDFYREAKRLRLTLDQATAKEQVLDLYRNANHRQISRFFHRLNYLGVVFARYLSGPDFVTGHHITLMQEHWQSSWSPLVESCLIELALLGATVEEAADTKLKLQIAGLQEAGQARSTQAAVALMVRACRLGLHARSHLLVPLIDVHIAEDANFPSVIYGLAQLELLQRAREPLEANKLIAVPRLMKAAYIRACRLLADAAHCANDDVENVLEAIKVLREVLSSAQGGSAGATTNPAISKSAPGSAGASNPPAPSTEFDRDLFFGALQVIIDSTPHQVQSAIIGGAAGVLYGEGKLSDTELARVVCGFLAGAINDARKTAGILRGLLATACEVAWQVGAVMAALDEQFQSWDEKTFVDLLPDLRLAFSTLTPRDVARVADRVSNLHDGKSLGNLVHLDVDEADLQFGLLLQERVQTALELDGLGIVRAVGEASRLQTGDPEDAIEDG